MSPASPATAAREGRADNRSSGPHSGVDPERGARYFLAESHRIAYLTIQKAGCTSFKQFIASLFMDEVPQQNRIHDDFPEEFRVRIPDFDRSQYFTFTVVRHPIERFLSFYRQKLGPGFNPRIARQLALCGIEPGMSVGAVLDAAMSLDPARLEAHLRPQSQTVLSGGTLRVDYIARLERLQTDWPRICAAIGIDHPLPIENTDKRSTTTPMASADYDKLLAFCAADLRLFGYPAPTYAEASERYRFEAPGSPKG